MHRNNPATFAIGTALVGLLLATFPLAVAAQSAPTDGLQLWLRADTGTEAAAGTSVAAWTDQSAHGRVLTQTDEARRPTYVPDAINGQPLLRFDADDGFDSAAWSPLMSRGSSYTIFRVTRQQGRGYVDVAEGQLGPTEDGVTLQRFFRGRVAEVLVYDRRLTEAEKTAVSRVLGERYRLAPGATAARSDDAAGGTGNGIRVHGAWTITVRNPDGSLDERRQLENQLASGGSKAFATYLARTKTVGLWSIVADGSQSSTPCGTSTLGSPLSCLIAESGSPIANTKNVFKNLTISAPTSGSNQDKLVLNGSFTAVGNGNVETISTRNKGCDSSTAPGSCSGQEVGSIFDMTTKTLSSPVSVSKGQQVNVQVVIGFQ